MEYKDVMFAIEPTLFILCILMQQCVCLAGMGRIVPGAVARAA